MQAFAFQPVHHESGAFCFEWIKACLRHDLSPHVESARCNMKSKLVINSPPPMRSDQMPRPGGSKRRQMPGFAREGGGGCLSFDLTGTLPTKE